MSNLYSASQFADDEILHLSAKIIGKEYAGFTVPVKAGRLNDQVSETFNIPKEDQKSNYGILLKNLRKYTPEMVEMMSRDKYEKWGRNVEMLMYLRHHLLGKAVEVETVGNRAGTSKLKKSGKNVMYDSLVAYWDGATKVFITPTDGGEKSAVISITTETTQGGTKTEVASYSEETVHQWLVDVRKYRKLVDTPVATTAMFVDRSGKEWHALRFHTENTRWDDALITAYEMIFAKSYENCPSATTGDVLFFRSKNKRDRAYEWLMKDKTEKK